MSFYFKKYTWKKNISMFNVRSLCYVGCIIAIVKQQYYYGSSDGSFVSALEAVPTGTSTGTYTNLPQYLVDIHDSIIQLHDDNFEHETQSITGQTTGNWLIYFYKEKIENKDNADNDNVNEIPMTGTIPSADVLKEKYYTTIGIMNTLSRYKQPKSTMTYRRFNCTTIPCFIYIQKGKYYIVPTKTNGLYNEYDWDTIMKFIDNPSAISQGHDVPPVPTYYSILVEELNKDKEQTQRIFYIIAILIFVSFFLLYGLVHAVTPVDPLRNAANSKKTR